MLTESNERTEALRQLVARLAGVPLFRGCLLFAAYATILAASFFCGYLLRWDFAIPADFAAQCAVLIVPVVLCTAPVCGVALML